MTPKELSALPTKDQFFAVRDKLNLTDRQKAVFTLKWSQGWRNIDIANELGFSQDTISSDIRDILPKLAAIKFEGMEDEKWTKDGFK